MPDHWFFHAFSQFYEGYSNKKPSFGLRDLSVLNMRQVQQNNLFMPMQP